MRTKKLSDADNIKTETGNVRNALLQNGFTWSDIRKAEKPRHTDHKTLEDPVATAVLPYVRGTTEKIGKILRQHKIRPVFQTTTKISNLLPTPKEKIPLECQGVYEIPCADCDKTYVGQTNRRISVRREEHVLAVHKKTKTSSLVQHIDATGHKINFDGTKMLAKIEHFKKRITREAIEIEKRPDNLNTRDDTQRLPTTWKPALNRKQITPRMPPVTDQTTLQNNQNMAVDRNQPTPAPTNSQRGRAQLHAAARVPTPRS